MSDRSKPRKSPRISRSAAAAQAGPARRGVLVLGMHRSGTSALTRVLSLLGGTLPRHLMGAGEGNEAGHWEPEKLVALHEALLAQAGSGWDDARPLNLSPPSVFARPETIDRIQAQITEDYGGAALMVLKDPRISRFVPVYRAVFQPMGVEPVAVIIVRNPLAVARSLMARKTFPIHSARYASLLWLRHLVDAEFHTRGMARTIVSHEGLIADWRRTAAQIEAALHLGLRTGNDDIAGRVQSFLSDELVHHDVSKQALARSSTILPMAKRAYAALLALEKNGQNGAALLELDQIREALDLATEQAGGAIFDEFTGRQSQLEAATDRVAPMLAEADQKTQELEALRIALTQAEAENRALDGKGAGLTTQLSMAGIAAERAEAEAADREKALRARIAAMQTAHETALTDMQARLHAATARAETLEADAAKAKAEIRRLAALEKKNTALIDQFRSAAKARDEQASALTAEVAELRRNVTAREAELAHASDMIAQAQTAATAAETDLIINRVHSYDLGESLSASQALSARLQAEATAQMAQAAGAQRRVAELDETVNALHNSLSWRLTSPLRAVGGGLRSLRAGNPLLPGTMADARAAWSEDASIGQGNGEAVVAADAPALPLPLPSPEAGAAPPEPLVSVIILNYNKPELTLFAVQRVHDHSRGIEVETIVVDNGSAFAKYEQLALQLPAGTKLIRLDVNRYFGEGNNIGAEAARGSYVVFLNNDAFVTEGWLEPMLDVFALFANVGGVGPKFIYPDGRLQEVGGLVTVDGGVEQLGKTRLPDPALLHEVSETQYSSSACFMMVRQRFYEIGGYDRIYEPAYFEDVDLCLKLRASGQKLYCTPFSTVIHAENVTARDASNKAMQLDTIYEHNQRKFVARWAKWIETPDTFIAKAQARLVCPPRTAHAGRVAVYAPFDLVAGGSVRFLLHSAQVLSQLYDVTLVTEQPYSAIRIRDILDDLNIPAFAFEMAVRSELTRTFDLAVMMSSEALPPFAHIGERNLYVCQFPVPVSDQIIADRRSHLAQTEAIIVQSGFVRDWLLRDLAQHGLAPPAIEVIHPAVDGLSIAARALPSSGPIRLLSIGRFFAGDGNKRQDALIAAAIDLHRRGVAVELDLVGSVHPEAEHRRWFRELTAMAEGYPIRFHPDASPDTVNGLLALSNIYCHAAGLGVNADRNPQFCDYFGISVVEAMRAGLVPFVVANGGPARIVTDGIDGYHYRSITELADGIAALIADPARYGAVSAAAHVAALKYNTADFTLKWLNACRELSNADHP